MQPAFSVLMSVYAKDRPAWVRETLDSVLSNTVKPTEVAAVIDVPIPTASIGRFLSAAYKFKEKGI